MMYVKPDGYKNATYVGIFDFPCYYDDLSHDVIPKYFCTDLILDLLIWYDVEFSDGFVIKVKEEK